MGSVNQRHESFDSLPVNSIFEVYKEQFSYDKTDLNARVESRDESSEDWIQEKIILDAAYGDSSIAAYTCKKNWNESICPPNPPEGGFKIL